MKNLAIIPARGGSRRIPGKNIRPFMGKPIIEYSIEAAKSSNLFEEIMVSTDSEEIRQVAEKCGANVPFRRSDENSNEFATLFDVVTEVIEKYKKSGIHFDNICCILATAPFVTADKIVSAYKLLKEKDFASVFPVSKFSYPIRRALRVDAETQLVSMIWPEYMAARSQDLQDAYHDCGQFYWASAKKIFQYSSFFTPDSGVIEVPQMQMQDIDNEEDWKLAEVKYSVVTAH